MALPKLYKAYFFRGKDPAIGELERQMQKHFGGKVTPKALEEVAKEGPSKAAMTGWFHGKTRRPQNATLEAAGRALGLKRVWVKR